MKIDHVGLSVSNLAASTAFFTECLDWRIFGERSEYPAAYVENGNARITLWQVENPDDYVPFDRRTNVGLHHLALKVESLEELNQIHRRVSSWERVEVEFGPEPSGVGPKIHSMIREPGGCRIEFAWDPR